MFVLGAGHRGVSGAEDPDANMHANGIIFRELSYCLRSTCLYRSSLERSGALGDGKIPWEMGRLEMDFCRHTRLCRVIDMPSYPSGRVSTELCALHLLRDGCYESLS